MSDQSIFNSGLITGIIFGCLFMFIITNPERNDKPKQPEIKPCNCVDYKTYSFRQAKYDMYIDSIAVYSVRLDKKSALRVADSVSKYLILLNF